MLKLILPILAIMWLEDKWDKTMITLSLVFMLSLSILYSPGTKMNLTLNMISISQLSATLIVLSIWISLLMIMSSRNQILKSNKKHDLFTMMIMWLTISMILVFSLENMILFYIFFEMALIPTLILILMWGYQPERLQASMYMIIYTVTASLPLLLVITLFMKSNLHLSFTMLMSTTVLPITSHTSLLLIPLMSAFLVKTPMFFLHLWLPKAHVEAPMAGSMILAAILLKLGGYGMIMMSYLNPFSVMNKIILLIAIIGGLMACILCMNQIDMKALIAYSSINHMALMIAGIMSNFTLGWKMAVMIMIAHGLCSSGLFMLAGMSFEKTHSRALYLNKSMIFMSPTFSMLWFILIMINMGAPPSINLLSEIFLISSILIFMKWSILLMFFTILISSSYNLYLYTTMNHGQMSYYSLPKKICMKNYTLTSFLHIIPIFMLILNPCLLVI